MNLVIVGASGMLGQDLVSMAADRGHCVTPLDRPRIDITDPVSCERAITTGDAVINCAAWTAVDDAESHEAAAFAVNAIGAANLARLAASRSMGFVQVSTDYVFRGDHSEPIAEDAPLAPLTAYGRTKAAGEWAALALHPRAIIVRTAWLYGACGKCFPKTVRDILEVRGSMSVVNDQVGQPTWTCDLADLILKLLEANAAGGIYHGTSSGEASWYDFARTVAKSIRHPQDAVSPTSSAEYLRAAQRPAYSVLGHEALRDQGIEPIGHWLDSWFRACAEVLNAG